ncbi:MAG: LysM peptidoglycan-binding domain-containing protein [Bacteroidales bacterium]|nr:LysM peptidoglycan-binding domain-containing protein [Bacteroidales bacterium]MBR5717209.1 LysM peptidoglycan-binding domain-containing protein [Bacteroidales bacterium]
MKILRKFGLTILLTFGLCCVQSVNAEVRYHTVQPGQTLYSISRAYGVTVDAIKAANPQIEGTSIPTGVKLIIPEATTAPIDMPLVPEVVNGQITEEPKRDTTANSTFRQTQDNGNVRSLWDLSDVDHWTDGTLNMAVILPFNLGAGTAAENKTQMRSVEFYEGVLMAVDEMQARGRRVTIQAYDTGSESLYNILANPQLMMADVVIAPMEENELRQVADWGERSGTPVISPFSVSNGFIDAYEHVFQVNVSKAMLYPRLTGEILQRFEDYTFVFIADSVGNRKVDPYPAQLKEALIEHNIPFRELSYLHPSRLMACDSILGLKDEPLVFVPVTPQAEAMRRMFSGLQHVKILRDARYQEALKKGIFNPAGPPKLAMLGYPEWILNTSDFIDYYYDLNVYMFSKVYANPFDQELKNFYANFKKWYGKEPMALVPKYGILGYDVAKFFLEALSRYGEHIEERLNGQLTDGLQNAFCFDRSMGRGFYNRGFYLVHFTPESTVEKIVVQ